MAIGPVELTASAFVQGQKELTPDFSYECKKDKWEMETRVVMVTVSRNESERLGQCPQQKLDGEDTKVE